jgi:hypothetical protein
MLKVVAALATQFLTLVEIAAGSGVTIAKLRRLAAKFNWRKVALPNGRRGRPPVAYYVPDVMASLAAI